MLAEARCDVVLTTASLANLLPPTVTAVTTPANSAKSIELKTEASQLAYVMFTSGTTGTPKGVEIEHGSLALLLSWHRSFFRLNTGVHTALLACVARDGLILDEWGTLSAGSTLAVPKEEILSSPELIGGFLEEHHVEHAYLPNAMFEGFLESGQKPSKLRSIATGSDQLRIWPAPDYPAGIYNVYGPTEATVLVTSSSDLRAEGDRTHLPNVGKAIAGAEVWLEADDGTKIDQHDIPGELVIAGPLLARGYRHQPELTATAFPINKEGVRTYRTGDICTWGKEGNIYLIGRRDGQVKVRGLRVEIGEVEQAILNKPGVRKVIVTASGNGAHSRLAALIEGSVDENVLRARLQEELPEAMIPESFAFVEALPATESEVVDRKVVKSSRL